MAWVRPNLGSTPVEIGPTDIGAEFYHIEEAFTIGPISAGFDQV